MCLICPVKQVIVRERHLVENHSMCTIDNIMNDIHVTTGMAYEYFRKISYLY